MRVLFLDIDGVLNSDAWFRSKNNRTEPNELDRDAVRRLDAIVTRAGAKVVISSTWRTGFSREALEAILAKHGFTGQVIDMTPELDNAVVGARVPGRPPRGEEIQAWLDAQSQKPVSFVILDDQTDMAHLGHRQVLTTYDRGLQDEHVDQALALFESDSFSR